jgi:hypothetical protein
MQEELARKIHGGGPMQMENYKYSRKKQVIKIF